MTPLLNEQQLGVLVAHASGTLRARLRAGLESAPDVAVQEAPNASLALQLFFNHRPKVALVNVCLPDSSGFEVIRCMRQSAPDCSVMLLVHTRDPFVDKVGKLLGAAGTCSEADALDCLLELVARRRCNPAPPQP